MKNKNKQEIEFIIQKEWYSIEQCKNNPNTLYIFGDNFMRVGKAGQAQIRDCQNTFGIATKWSPSNRDDAFFSDNIECENIISNDIQILLNYLKNSNTIKVVFPADGLGTGLSNLQKKAPGILLFLNNKIKKMFNIKLGD